MTYTRNMAGRIEECRLIEVPRFTDHRGSLSVIEGPPLLPFKPKRLYYIYESTREARRGCHAHRMEKELILALAGSFKVTTDDGTSTCEFLLSRPDLGLFLPPLVWHDVHSFTADSVCAVLASELYRVEDYYRRYEEFVEAVHKLRR